MIAVKAVAIDIDGTITDETRAVNCKTVVELRKIEIPVILVTGNVMCYARTAAKLLGFSEIVVAENGGVVRFEYDGKDLILGDKQKCLDAMELLSEHFPVEPLDLELRLSEVALRRTFPIEDAEKLLNLEAVGVKIVDSGFAYHLMDKSVSKGKALEIVAERLEISLDEFVAIGDSENDIDMLNAVGYGVAVANAHPSLKRVAKLVTEASNGDGVIEALKKIGVLR